MNLKEKFEYIERNNYVLDNPNKDIDELFKLYINGDNSLVTDEMIYPNFFYTDKEKENFIKSKTESIFLGKIRTISIKNVNNLDFLHYKKLCSYFRNYPSYETLIPNFLINCIINCSDNEVLEIFKENTNYIDYLDFLRIIIRLYKHRHNVLNRTDKSILEFIEAIIKLLPSDLVIENDEGLLNVLPVEYLELISKYYANIINYISEDKLTSTMINNARNSNNFYLNSGSPKELLIDRDFVIEKIKKTPSTIRFIPSFMEDLEYRSIAINNGLKINYEDFVKYNIYSSQLLLSELESFYNLIIEHNDYSLKLVISKDKNTNIFKIHNLLNYALTKKTDLNIILNFFKKRKITNLLTEFERKNLSIDFILNNHDFCISILDSLDCNFANKIKFKPDKAFVDKFYNCGFFITSNASDEIRNSSLLFNEAFNYGALQVKSALKNSNRDFVKKEHIIKAFELNVDLLSDGLYEVSDPLLKEDVLNSINAIKDPEYKKFIELIIAKAGYTIYYVECNNILSYEVFKVFDANLITTLIRNLSFCGISIDLSGLINLNKLDSFYEFYLKYKNTNEAREFKYLLDFYYNNMDLTDKVMSSNLDATYEEGFREYVNHKDRLFIVQDIDSLEDIHKTIYEVNEEFIARDDINIELLKSIIISSLFNLGYFEVENLLGIVGNGKLDKLKANINNYEYISFIDFVKPYVELLEEIFECRNMDVLREMANNINLYCYKLKNEADYIRNTLGTLESCAKLMFTEELNNFLTQIPKENNVEFEDDSFFLAHVMNAFGNGSKLSDFKNPRFIGKTYICLTLIGKGVEPYFRTEKDINHVTLLFNQIPPKSLISMSHSDMGSRGEDGDRKVYVTNKFDTASNILDKTNGIPNEYVVYRESETGDVLYPCGVLVRENKPSMEELEAASYLGIPTVKRKKIDKNYKKNDIECISYSENDSNNKFEIYDEILAKLHDLDNDFPTLS